SAISTVAKTGIAAGIGLIAGALGGYFVGTTLKPVETVTIRETITRTTEKTITIPTTVATMISPTEKKVEFEGVELKVLAMSDPPNIAFEKLAKEFAEKHGMKMQFEMYDWEHLKEKIMTALPAGVEYDIVLVDEPWIGELEKYLYDMEKLMKEYGDPALLDFDDILPGVIDSLRTFEGKLIGFPMMTDVRFLAYRRSYFEDPDNKRKFRQKYGYELKPPLNYYEFFDVVEFIVEETDMPYGFGDLWQKDYLEMTFGDWLYSLGGRFFDEKLIPQYDSPEGIIALRLLLKSLEYGPENKLELNHELLNVAFFTEKVPMVLQWWSVTNEMLDPEVNPVIDDTGFAPSFHNLECSGMMAYAIPLTSPNPAQAYKLLEWVYSQQNAAKLIGLGGTPIRKSTLQSEELRRQLRIPEQWDAALLTLQRGLWSRPKIKYHGIHDEVICSWVHRVMSGEVDIEEALRRASEEVKREFEKAGVYR
ncbi:MAG: extracellular solute-binding protein, partial [Nitrososphaerota archaeon]